MFVRTYASSRVKRKSFYRKSKLQMFLISRGHTTFTRGPKRYTNSVLSRVGKSAIFVLNRVRVWVAEPHLPTPRIYRVPPPPGVEGYRIKKEGEYIHTPWGGFALKRSALNLDCSQSPFFSCDRSDIPRLTVTGILIFKCTEGRASGIIALTAGKGNRTSMYAEIFYNFLRFNFVIVIFLQDFFSTHNINPHPHPRPLLTSHDI